MRNGNMRLSMRAGAVLVLGALLGMSGAHAAAELSLEQILARNAEARGGAAKWHEVETLTMSGMMDAGRLRPPPVDEIREVNRGKVQPKSAVHIRRGNPPPETTVEPKMVQLPFSLEMKRPQKVRLELQFDGKTAVQVYDGVHGWKKQPWLADPGARAYTEEEERMAAQDQAIDGFLIDHAAKGSLVALEGADKVNGRDAYRLKVTLKSGNVRHVWVDKASFLETQIDGKRRMNGKEVTVLTALNDYRRVNGLVIPFSTETRTEGAPDAQKILVEHVAVNEAVADVHFIKP